MITGKINLAGYYRDCLPIWIINIKHDDAGSIPLQDEGRASVTLNANGMRYVAGVRAMSYRRGIKICPDVFDEDGSKIKLTDILRNMGYSQSDTIKMNAEAEQIEIYAKD